jgi:hypothetical protein
MPTRIRLRWFAAGLSGATLALFFLIVWLAGIELEPFGLTLFLVGVVGYNVVFYVVWKSAEQAFRQKGIRW